MVLIVAGAMTMALRGGFSGGLNGRVSGVVDLAWASSCNIHLEVSRHSLLEVVNLAYL